MRSWVGFGGGGGVAVGVRVRFCSRVGVVWL